jgi:hypothetical protein
MPGEAESSTPVQEVTGKSTCVCRARKRLVYARLAQANVYNRLKQQQLQPLIRIRNHADHGEFGEFSADDVAGMIRDVRAFLADQLR